MENSTIILIFFFAASLTASQTSVTDNESIETKIDATKSVDDLIKRGDPLQNNKSSELEYNSIEPRLGPWPKNISGKTSEDSYHKNEMEDRKLKVSDHNIKTSLSDHLSDKKLVSDFKTSAKYDGAEEISSEIADKRDEIHTGKNNRSGKEYSSLSEENFESEGFDGGSIRQVNSKSDEVAFKSTETVVNASPDTTQYTSFKPNGALLDTKGRTGENSGELLNSQGASELDEINAAEVLGSRRSYTGSYPNSPDLVNFDRPRQISDTSLLSMPNPMFIDKNTNQGMIPINNYLSTSIPSSGFNKPNNRLNFNSVPTPELGQLQKFAPNAFSNTHSYELQQPTTTTPGPIKNYLNLENSVLSKVAQPFVAIQKPLTKLTGQNIPNLAPTLFNPLQRYLPVSVVYPYKPRFYQLRNLPVYYYKKCNYCT